MSAFENTESAESVVTSSDSVNVCAQWRERISNIQREKMSPEVFNQLKEKAERQKRVQRAYKTANILERCNTATVRAQESTMKRSYFLSNTSAPAAAPPRAGGGMFGMFGRASSNPPALQAQPTLYSEQESRSVVEDAYSHTASRNTARSKSVQQILQTRRTRDVAEMNDADEEENFQQITAQLDAMEQELHEDEAEADALPAQLASVGLSSIPAPSAAEGFPALLQSLSREPTDSVEVTAKYTIFENYLETVVAIREQTIAFWQSNRTQFDGQALLAGDKSIAAIDNEQSLGIQDTSYHWFVYDMMQKAHQNHCIITNTLAEIKRKLELLMTNEEIDCPFCLEAVTKENGFTLGCCHKTCKECWSNWQVLKGNSAFCPLCRREEFVQDLFAEAI